ncbi:hypothetical protein JCM17478_17580 [Thermopirellula anaerolimosa]
MAAALTLLPWLDARAEIRLEKSDRGITIVVEGADDAAVVPVAPGRWVLVWAAGSPAKLQTAVVTVGPSDPAPPTPQPEAEASRLAREWLSLVPDEARAKAPQLAGAFRGVAVRIASGELRDPNSIINASVAANRETLGEHRNAWLPWFQRLRDYMNTLAESGKLTTPEAHGALFRDLASGLEANAR